MKIVELLIEKLEDLLPFESVALVKEPAIQADFYAFNDEQILDKIAFETIKLAVLEKFVDRIPGESKDEYMGRCIPKLKSEGFQDDQASAICYETFEIVEPNINVFGYHTKHFDVGPGAVTTFNHLITMDPDAATIGMVRVAAVVIDSIFELEKKILAKKTATQHEYDEVFRLADDFRDVMREIDKGLGMEHDIDWVQGHIDTVAKYLVKDSLSQKEAYIAKLSTQDQKNIRETLALQESSNNFKFNIEEEQMKVTGPLLIPNKLILRLDEDENPYYVFFSEDTVKQISERMIKDKRVDQVNLEHDSNIMVDSVMTESWLVTDPANDKSNIYGMTMPKNTWMATYQINDPKVWSLIKAGVLKGFSLEGYFADKLAQA